MMALSEVEEEWENVTKELPKPVKEWWWAEILKKYSENNRAAHNINYLHSKILIMKELSLKLSNATAFILAIFFQYFHYDLKDNDCCNKNVESFEKFATEASLLNSPDIYNKVKSLLEASFVYCTEEHKTEGAYGEEDIHYFLDLDMAWLGRDGEEYKKHADNVQAEYSEDLDPTAYKRLRQRVLKSLLLIPNIFATKIFRNELEAKARDNIQQELKYLLP